MSCPVWLDDCVRDTLSCLTGSVARQDDSGYSVTMLEGGSVPLAIGLRRLPKNILGVSKTTVDGVGVVFLSKEAFAKARPTLAALVLMHELAHIVSDDPKHDYRWRVAAKGLSRQYAEAKGLTSEPSLTESAISDLVYNHKED